MQKYANLVELEKCCQTHIFLRNFVLIQPRTSPLKICKILQNLQSCCALPLPGGRPAARRARGPRSRGAGARARAPRAGTPGAPPGRSLSFFLTFKHSKFAKISLNLQKPTSASKHAFCNIFRAPQDIRTVAPKQFENERFW